MKRGREIVSRSSLMLIIARLKTNLFILATEIDSAGRGINSARELPSFKRISAFAVRNRLACRQQYISCHGTRETSAMLYLFNLIEALANAYAV